MNEWENLQNMKEPNIEWLIIIFQIKYQTKLKQTIDIVKLDDTETFIDIDDKLCVMKDNAKFYAQIF